MPDDAGLPDWAVPDHVPEEWLTQYGSAGRRKFFTGQLPEDAGSLGFLLLLSVGVLGVFIASVTWPSPSGWVRIAMLGWLAVLTGGCWVMERLGTERAGRLSRTTI